ncbi:MAG: hypothetical protein JSV19_12850 [Phycisphaerales bacterium]|nr:MAG: hypothetical protein JSV19_12850 [Phycisphaerales bacterium]
MRRLNGVVCVALLAGITAPAAADFTYELSVKFNGSTPASPSLPWTEATFEQEGVGDVKLTLSATNLMGDEFISEWYFNVLDVVDPTQLVFTPDGTLPFTVLGIEQQSNAFQADGDGLFDIRFDFIHTLGPGDQFVGQEVGTWIISHPTMDLNPEMFWDTSMSAMEGGIEGLYTAAHLGGIDGEDEGNSWITVIPAPGAALLGAVGLGLIHCVKRRYV